MPEPLRNRVLAGDRRAVARAISLVEDGAPERAGLLRDLYPKGTGAYVCGITGPPGAGKSTLVEQLALRARGRKQTVGIVAVDPSSPFTGGALLGDRIRMAGVATDPGVFIRSMASRGSRGGLARAAREAAVILGAMGADPVLLETVGVGQVELDVAETADTTLVVLVPESGDGIQAMKAGLMEIGDVFVINKADRDGAEGVRVELESVLHLRAERAWAPPVLKTVASKGEGIGELDDALAAHRTYLVTSGEGARRRRHRVSAYIKEIVSEALSRRLWEEGGYQERLEERLEAILEGRSDPFTVADEILAASGMLATPEGEHR